MSLLPRPSTAGDRLTWRRPTMPLPVPVAPALQVVDRAPAVDRQSFNQDDIDAHRAAGVRRALDHLGATHTSPAYRRQRAVLALGRAVELQARTAGIGHVHVGTGACGAMCEAVGQHAAAVRLTRATGGHDVWLATEDAEVGYAFRPCCSCGWTGPDALRDPDAADLAADEHRGSA